MKRRRHRMAARILGMLLAALALSPLTAPFSTVDIADLLGEASAGDGAILQSKKAGDHSPADDDGRRCAPLPPSRLSAAAAGVPEIPPVRRGRPVPLRI